MEYLEKLDFILKKLSAFDSYKKEDFIFSLMDDKISDAVELRSLLEKLYADRNIDFFIGEGYKININGKMMLNPQRGYFASDKQIQQQTKNIRKSICWSILNTVFVIISVVIALATFIYMVYFDR